MAGEITALASKLSRQIVEAHSGSIWAESRQPKGAVFAFQLPAQPPVQDNILMVRATNSR